MTDMNKTAHTPGPWGRRKYGDLTGSNGRKVQMADSGMAFVSAYENPEAVANTTLCHAAPELLEALINMRALWWDEPSDSGRRVVVAADAAIAKATGAPA